MDFILSKLAFVGPFFLLLGVLIFIHEWGHFIVARMCGVRVETFSIGFGPKIFKKKWGDTTYALSVIPLGGYVKMFGDGSEDFVPEAEKPQSFEHQKIWEKIAIVSAGPLMNLIFAFFLFAAMGATGIPKMKAVIGDVQSDSPAYEAGLRYGDTITAVNGKEVSDAEEFQKELMKVSGDSVEIATASEDGQTETHTITLKKEENLNPLIQAAKINSIPGMDLMRVSNSVGIDYRSPLQNQGAQGVVKITKINNSPTEDFHQIKKAVAKTPASSSLSVTLKQNSDSQTLQVEPLNKNSEDAFWSSEKLGLVNPGLFIGNVRSGSPAAEAGIESGHQVLAINETPINKWEELLEEVSSTKKGEMVTFSLGTKEGEKTIKVTPEQTEILKPNGQVEYRPTVGILPALEYLPPPKFYKTYSGVGELFSHGYQQSTKWIHLTLTGFKKLLTGEVSHKTLSGVISIGKVAKDSLDVGWSYFIQIMAIISINLFLLNLLPVPVLDGGHLLFYFIELCKGSPVSLTTRLIGQQIGLVVILSLVAYTIFNDLTRIVFSGW